MLSRNHSVSSELVPRDKLSGWRKLMLYYLNHHYLCFLLFAAEQSIQNWYSVTQSTLT